MARPDRCPNCPAGMPSGGSVLVSRRLAMTPAVTVVSSRRDGGRA